MNQELVQKVCDHCGTLYTACQGRLVVHCVQCFVCQQYQPLHAMYGRVGGKGYCCRACEAKELVSRTLVFEVLLNVPQT